MQRVDKVGYGRRLCRVATGGWLPALLLPLLLGLAACGDNRGRPGPEAERDADAAVPQRIVCGAPSVAEIVFALGLGDRVVGVSDYTVYPPEAKEKKSIGGWLNPSRERLLRMQPDVIITQGKHEKLADFSAEYGIRFVSVKLDTLDDVYADIQTIADTLGAPEQGAALSEEVRRKINAVRAQVADKPAPRVLVLFGREPGGFGGLATVGPGTFLDDLLRVAGGTNIFADARGAYPQVSKESLLVRRPEVILEINPGDMEEGTVVRLRADWREFPDLPAVENDRIHYLGQDFLLIPGPRVGRSAETFAAAIHGACRTPDGEKKEQENCHPME